MADHSSTPIPDISKGTDHLTTLLTSRPPRKIKKLNSSHFSNLNQERFWIFLKFKSLKIISFAKPEIMNGRSIKINRVPAIIAFIVTCTMIYIFNIYMDKEISLYGMLRNTDQVNMRKLLIGAIQAAQRGGFEILHVSRTRNINQRSKGKTSEGVDDPYTAADGRSHCAMKHGLLRIFPKLTIISEEEAANQEKCTDFSTFDLDPTVLHETANIPDELVNVKDVTIWIDPLDATKEFTEKLYTYVTTMVCVAVNGVPIIGVIHSPFHGRTAWAWVGVSISEYLSNIKKDDLNSGTRFPIVTVSRSHAGDVKNVSKIVFGGKSSVLVAAGAGFKILQVISNNATAYLHTTKIKKWDICAGNAIINAFGGKMTTLENDIIDYSNDMTSISVQGLLATLVNHDFYISKLAVHKNIDR